MESNGMKAFACENWSVRFSHSVANEKRRTSEQQLERTSAIIATASKAAAVEKENIGLNQH